MQNAAQEVQESRVRPEARDAQLALVLRRERRGAVLDVVPVTGRELVDPLAELWFDGFLRRGFPDLGLAEVRAELRPVFAEEEGTGRYTAGFELSTRDPSGAEVKRRFERECLRHLALHRSERLVDEGTLQSGDLFYYSLEPGGGADELSGPGGRGSPELLRLPLGALRRRVRETVGETENHFPVFYTQQALERAELISRKGARAQPAVETGGLLVGPLGLCPDSGELFAVVVDVIEATETEATTYSLAYSGATWARIQNILRARQQQEATRGHRVLGVCHGHNFLPLAGAPPCEVCDRLPVCTRTSALLSEEDRSWSRAHFSAEPWNLSQIYGLDARSRQVEAFFGQRGGRLVRRGYHVVDGFDVDAIDSTQGEI